VFADEKLLIPRSKVDWALTTSKLTKALLKWMIEQLAPTPRALILRFLPVDPVSAQLTREFTLNVIFT
jgi:hypothetical protein